MSSEIDGIGIIAAPVILPAAVAFGAGWLAWQGGKLLVEANRSANRQIAEKKRQSEEAARHRKKTALAAHGQLLDMCSQILKQIEGDSAAVRIMGLEEIEQIKSDLKKIRGAAVPDDPAQIESLTSLGYLKLDEIVHRQHQIAEFKLEDSKAGLYRGLAVADIMDELRVAIEAMEIKATVGKNITAADPAVLERAKLNESFTSVTEQIMAALEHVNEISSLYGLTESADVWFHSCFNGIDILIDTLCRPTTSNNELKKGIRRLEEAFERYEMMAESTEKELAKMRALYDVYADTAKVLGEKAEVFRAFRSSAEIEEQLRYLQTRAEKAQACAAVYQKLGPAAYMCYALDQELQAMGYEVHTRNKIMEMASQNPQYAKLGENRLPFYEWNEEELTQLYSITSECSLQVIVHEDGAVSMQTIAEADNSEVVTTQHSHCSQLKTLHERLRKNWFILYDFEETGSPDSVTTVAGWKASDGYAWKETGREIITDQRAKGKTEEKSKYSQ